MLNSTDANLLTNRLNGAFARIGTYNDMGVGDTHMPDTTRNTEHVAWEFHIASHLYRMAEGRKKSAQKAAVKAGIIFDHEKKPLPAGTNQSVYNGDVVQIGVAVKVGSSRIDHTAFTDDLIAAGVSRDLVEQLSFKHTKMSRPPHTFTTSLVTSGG